MASFASKFVSFWRRTNNEGKIAAINQAVSSYEEMYKTYINKPKQCKISDYLEQNQPAQPCDADNHQPVEADNPQPSSVSCLFEGDSHDEFAGFMNDLTYCMGGGNE